MKHLFFLLPCIFFLSGNAQLINKQFNQQVTNYNANCGIITTDNSITILANSVYRATPEGYHITFTTSFIGESVEDVESKMNKKIDDLIQSVKSLKITKKDVLIDLIALDPIFETNITGNSNQAPIGYKITENLTFNISDFGAIRFLAKKCMDFGIYDIITVKPYILSTKAIYDSLANKTLEVLEFKKDLCKKVGWAFSGGKMNFSKCKNVYYPSDSYIKSLVKNENLYMHHISQNSSISVLRNVQVDNYQNLDLKNVDFIFHSNVVTPVIQFYYQIQYNYTKKPEKIEEAPNPDAAKEKVFYILDKEGNLKKFDF